VTLASAGLIWTWLQVGTQTGAAGTAASDPRAIVTAARRAVETDRAAAVTAEWRARVASDPVDRAALLGLATIDRLEYRYDDAELRYAALAIPTDTGPIATYAWLGRGWAEGDRDFMSRADSAFARARALSRVRHDRLAEAEGLIGVEILRAANDGVPAGLATLDTAERLLPPLPAAMDLRAEIAFRRATLDVVISRPGADREAREAVVIARRAEMPRAEARAWRALALYYKLKSDLDSVAIVLRQVEQLQRAAHDHGELAVSIVRRADIYQETGDMGLYRPLVHEARAEATIADNQLILAGTSVGLGIVALRVNDYPMASAQLADALTRYLTIGDTGGAHTVLAYQGDLANALGDLPRARALYQGEVAFNRKIGDGSQVFEFWRSLATVDRRTGDLDAATRDLDSAATTARANRNRAWLDNLRLDRGALALARGRPEDAARFLTQFLTNLDTSAHMSRYDARVLRALAYARAERFDDAARELGGSEDEVDAWRSSLTDRDMRILAFQANGQEVNDRDAGVATVIAALGSTGRAAAAFALAERRRARELTDHIVQLEAMQEAPNPAKPAAVGAAGGPAPHAQAQRAMTPDSAAAVLPDGQTALLEYVTGARGAPTTLFAIARGPAGGAATVRAYVMPSADSLAVPIARLVALLESGRDASALTRELGTALISPALVELGPGFTRLIVVPDGPLHHVPFDALSMPNGRPLVEQAAVSVAPSAGALRALIRRGPVDRESARPARILAFGDPAFPSANRDDPEIRTGPDGYRSAFDSAGGLAPLPESGREATLVAGFAPRSVLRLGTRATAAYLVHTALDSFTVIHFATHAVVDDRTADRTALALTPGGGESGFVTPAEISALRLGADLVVLSTCQSAGGVVVDGEGVQGLTAPFLAAGARNVVATQWRIRDRATVPFIAAFYDAMARGMSIGDALRAAKLGAIARGSPMADWAAFTTVGDPNVRLALVVPSGDGWRQWWLAALLMILLTAAVGTVVAARGRLMHRASGPPPADRRAIERAWDRLFATCSAPIRRRATA